MMVKKHLEISLPLRQVLLVEKQDAYVVQTSASFMEKM